AEDGIRLFHVTGVQTCALPISLLPSLTPTATVTPTLTPTPTRTLVPDVDSDGLPDSADLCPTVPGAVINDGCPLPTATYPQVPRSEERRVGIECGLPTSPSRQR